jgi:hypothetical protein
MAYLSDPHRNTESQPGQSIVQITPEIGSTFNAIQQNGLQTILAMSKKRLFRDSRKTEKR